MVHDEVQADIPASADAVWALVGDFWAIADYFPGVSACRQEGEERVVSLGTTEVRERLVERDEGTRTLRYSIVGGVPVEHHEAAVEVRPAGDGASVTWSYEVEPDQMGPALTATYGQALEALRRHFA